MKVTIKFPASKPAEIGPGRAWAETTTRQIDVELSGPPNVGHLLELPDTEDWEVFKVDHVVWNFSDGPPTVTVGAWWDHLRVGEWPTD